MLQLKNIIKKYKTGGNDVEVLKSGYIFIFWGGGFFFFLC